ncbi:hypothetical protein WN944_026587 [Citrus x changshan-huyou]|uniref:PGG domain-containing protein n=1 Tax=Citrus x changshan-huyou TaxID=2935761 RepID=A0AAP0LYB5_9ROSI
MDVKIAFLTSDLDEEIYMEQPEGFVLPGNETKRNLESMDLGVLQELHCKCNGKSIATRTLQFVNESMPRYLFLGCNKGGKTPKEIFTKAHKELVKNGQEWLPRLKNLRIMLSCGSTHSAFATSVTVPGGLNRQSCKPILENEPAFKISAISSFVALCFSVTAFLFFLSILTSRYREKDFPMALPRKFPLALTSVWTKMVNPKLEHIKRQRFVCV